MHFSRDCDLGIHTFPRSSASQPSQQLVMWGSLHIWSLAAVSGPWHRGSRRRVLSPYLCVLPLAALHPPWLCQPLVSFSPASPSFPSEPGHSRGFPGVTGLLLHPGVPYSPPCTFFKSQMDRWEAGAGPLCGFELPRSAAIPASGGCPDFARFQQLLLATPAVASSSWPGVFWVL